MLQSIRKLNEGSLLQRTLLHIGVFVAGSATVVALTSVALVSTAKAVFPPHDETEASAEETKQEGAEADADSSSPEAAADTAGAKGKTFAQMRLANRRESAAIR
ncbi:uncharacterized protein SOCE26_019240 [Sorangium cellulosum]|uniref:Uncharacterized protein n=1 Tax=Sorangium cellulosum TaxID=56 RepID=A0A2L0EMJ7_SORCE|nr:hypothetical protein [Sorangium cellulosum]AUX40523.1 uncharacterized protein SOCE26_019240 [Sorangium cellulosum]